MLRKNETWIEYRKRMLDPVSDTFCAAKWLNATIWLGHGATASCQLPPAHYIDPVPLKENPSAIHNTVHKKKIRKLMLDGHKPKECDYCWRLEGMKTDAVSDRMFRSSRFTDERILEAGKKPWDADSPLETLEISFDRVCQFACSYCNAGFSTTWAKDINQHGAYQNLITDGAGSYHHNGDWAEPYGKQNKGNPYVEAFWNWWPELSKTLKQLRVTGGEPLMSPEVWKLFDFFKEHGPSEMIFAINSNLGGKDELIDRLIENSHYVKNFEFFTSNESYGVHAEYIRDGMDFAKWVSNVEKVLERANLESFHMMMTIDALSLFSLPEFLDLMMTWKRRFPKSPPNMSLNILRFPSFMSPLVLPDDIREERRMALVDWIEKNKTDPVVTGFDIEHIRRLVDYLDIVKTPHLDADDVENLRRDFKTFYVQYDRRRGKNISDTFPALREWLNSIPETDLGTFQPLISGHVAPPPE